MGDNYNANELRAAINILNRVLANLEGFDAPRAEAPRSAEPPADVPPEPDYFRDAPPPTEEARARPQPQRGDFPKDPLAKSMNDLVTPKQLGLIRALAREASVDADEECQQVLRVRTEELSKKAASSFIDHLKTLQNGVTARTAS